MEGEDSDQKSKENEDESEPEEAPPQEGSPPQASPAKGSASAASPAKASPSVASPAKASPSVATPAKASPSVATPAKASPSVASPEVISTKGAIAEEPPPEESSPLQLISLEENPKIDSPSKVSSGQRSRSKSITPYQTGSVSFKDDKTPDQKASVQSGGLSGSGSAKFSRKTIGEVDEQIADVLNGSNVPVVRGAENTAVLHSSIQGIGGFPCTGGILEKRSPFIHNPPQPEERRARIACPRCPRDYIINLREDLADFQESHGLPRTRDYSFLSLGLALAQETGRAIYSVFLMFTELFPILAIISLILRFALDKLIEILETTETVPKIKKSVIFALEMLAIMIPLWILIGTIIIPLITLLFSIFKRMLRIKGGKKKVVVKPIKPKGKVKSETC